MKSSTVKQYSLLFPHALPFLVKSDVLALFNEEPSEMINKLDEVSIRLKNIDKNKVEELVAKRNKARENKDWEAADQIRDELAGLGVELSDGQSRGWRVILND